MRYDKIKPNIFTLVTSIRVKAFLSSNVIDYITMRKLDRFKRNRTEGLQDYVTMPVYEDRKRYNKKLKVRQS